MTPTKTVGTGCLRIIYVMEMSIFDNRQVGTVPGHYGPSQAASTSDSRQEAGMGQSRATSFNLRMLHWNAEGVRNTKLELQVLLKERKIDVCCIQETHLNSSHRFSIRGYETFRRDRKDRPKGGILTLVKILELKSHPFAPADWKHKPQPMSCRHALSTKEKEKAPGQQKVS